MDFLPIVEQTIQEIMEVANGKGFMALASIIYNGVGRHIAFYRHC